jgi:hypothetical protein
MSLANSIDKIYYTFDYSLSIVKACSLVEYMYPYARAYVII